MLTKPLGDTPVTIPAIGQGAGDYFWNADIDNGQKVALLRKGIDLGMNLIDTAEEYGNGISEEIVGKAIQKIRDQVVVATKFSPQHNGYDNVIKAAEGSLKRLGTDYIDVYQVHWTNPGIPLSETMFALRRLLESGKVRCVGVCNFSQMELQEAREYLGEHRIASLQTEFNLFERTVEYSGLLSSCTESRITVMAYSPLDQGRFSSISSDKLAMLTSVAKKHNVNVAQLTLRWLVSYPAVVAIARTTKERHLMENGQATDFDLSIEDIDRIRLAFPFEIIHAPTDRIRVSSHGEWDHAVYQTIEEAIENRQGFVPSPVELAKAIRKGEFLKPVRVLPSTDERYDYELIGGRIRYWAWVIAHQGKLPIAIHVRESHEGNSRV